MTQLPLNVAWAQSSNEGRADLLAGWTQHGRSVGCSTLGIWPEALDAVAIKIGLRGVWVTTTQADGSCFIEAGVMHPHWISRHTAQRPLCAFKSGGSEKPACFNRPNYPNEGVIWREGCPHWFARGNAYELLEGNSQPGGRCLPWTACVGCRHRTRAVIHSRVSPAGWAACAQPVSTAD